MKIKNGKEILIFVFLVFLFSIIIFILKTFLFVPYKDIEIEENFIEPTNLKASVEKDYKDVLEDGEIIEENFDFSKILLDLKKIEREEAKKKIIYNFIPSSFAYKSKTLVYKKFFDTFFLAKTINDKIKKLEISIYKNPFEVRGRLKDRKIYIFGLYNIPFKEALSVSIHEFGHFFDLYILRRGVFKDPSYDFYKISWDERFVIRKGQKTLDFVSGYAMTNRYEDFAESFNFYILQNKEFKKRAEKSEKLRQKYDFFREKIFINDEFIDGEYSFEIKQKNIWDTTKLDYDFEKFSEYIEKIE